MRFLPLLFCAFQLLAQTTDTLTFGSSVPLPKGGTGSFQILYTPGTAGDSAGIQFTLSYPVSQVTSISVVADSSSTTAAKSITCAPGAGAIACVLTGINLNLFPAGPIAKVTVTATASATGSLAMSLGNTLAASLAGAAVVLTPPATWNWPILSSCDVNGSGTTDISDLNLVTGAATSAALAKALGQPVTCSASYDLNKDGVCDIRDAVIVAIAAAGGACNASMSLSVDGQ